MIDEPNHNLDGSTDTEATPSGEVLPPAQTFHHEPPPVEHGLPPQDLMPPLPEAAGPEQPPYVSSYGQMPPPPVEQMPSPSPTSGGTGYAAPPAWSPPPPAPPPTIVTQAVRSEFPLRTVLLIAVPICIIAVVIAIYLFNNSSEDEPLPATPGVVSKIPAAGPAGTPAATTFAAGSGNGVLSPTGAGGGGTSSPTPPAAPVVLSGGGTGGGGGSATNSGLAGRWVSRQPDYYQFNADGSGSHGTLPSSKPTQAFNWTVQSHQVKLYPQGGAAQESLAFSFGPDAKSVFLRQPDGKFREYALVSNSDSGG